MRKKGDLNDFEQGMVVGGELGFPHTNISRFTENDLKQKKYPVSNRSPQFGRGEQLTHWVTPVPVFSVQF